MRPAISGRKYGDREGKITGKLKWAIYYGRLGMFFGNDIGERNLPHMAGKKIILEKEQRNSRVFVACFAERTH